MRLLESRGVTIRVATEKLIAEEAPESYKDVSQVHRVRPAINPDMLLSQSLLLQIRQLVFWPCNSVTTSMVLLLVASQLDASLPTWPSCQA